MWGGSILVRRDSNRVCGGIPTECGGAPFPGEVTTFQCTVDGDGAAPHADGVPSVCPYEQTPL